MSEFAGLSVDERITEPKFLGRPVLRPEAGALLDVVVFFFALGIVALAVSLLMIGGEFDLSAGVITASTSLVPAMLAAKPAGSTELDVLEHELLGTPS